MPENAQSTAQTLKPRDDGEISSLIAEATQLTAVLQDNINLLEDRLACVIVHEPEGSNSNPDVLPMKTATGADLLRLLVALQRANSAVVSLRERTEV